MPKKKRFDETVAMGVRLTLKQRDELEKIATRNGVEVADLIRWAVKALTEHVERNGGRLLLPIDFSETYVVATAAEEKARKRA